jgi:phage shock protein C
MEVCMPKITPGKRLTRGQDKMLFGVCSGVAHYFGLDVTLVRLMWVLVTAFTTFIPGVVAYIVAAVVMPEV